MVKRHMTYAVRVKSMMLTMWILGMNEQVLTIFCSAGSRKGKLRIYE